MAISTLLLAMMTVTLVGATFHARRLGNEKRDVALPGAFSGMCGVRTAVAAILWPISIEVPIPFLVTDFMGKPAWVWLAFVGIVVALSVHGEVLQRT